LHYRLALEQLSEGVRERSAGLIAGANLLPGQSARAWERVSAGANPTQLVGGLLAILSMAGLARHAMRRRLAGGVLGDRIEGGGSPF
jgi:hypothetical protein